MIKFITSILGFLLRIIISMILLIISIFICGSVFVVGAVVCLKIIATYLFQVQTNPVQKLLDATNKLSAFIDNNADKIGGK